MDHAPRPADPPTDAMLAAAHALRDREESERTRQLGGLLVHDLNNVLFALLGRVQLLERRASDPATAKAAHEILETTRLLEAQVVQLHAACRRDEPTVERSPARGAVSAAFAESLGVMPLGARPRELDQALLAIPADATFAGAPEQIATAIRQLVSIHRARGPLAVTIALDRGDEVRVRIVVRDVGGAPASVPGMPSLLGGAFSLDGLPLAAAQRAIRDFGGRVSCAAEGRGLASELSFAVTIGMSIARFDARGSEQDHTPCEHDADCVPEPRRVLIADDDPGVRAVLVAALEAVGDEVDTLADPSACDGHPDLAGFDVIVLDAGGGGLEALARLRARGVDVPVLVASGEIVERSADPRTRCMLKPIPLDTLDRELTSLARLRGRQ